MCSYNNSMTVLSKSWHKVNDKICSENLVFNGKQNSTHKNVWGCVQYHIETGELHWTDCSWIDYTHCTALSRS